MTSPGDQDLVLLPAADARQALDLLQIAGHLTSALRARSRQRDLALADLDQLAALLTSGGDAAQLAARFEAAQQALAAAILTGRAP